MSEQPDDIERAWERLATFDVEPHAWAEVLAALGSDSVSEVVANLRSVRRHFRYTRPGSEYCTAEGLAERGCPTGFCTAEGLAERGCPTGFCTAPESILHELVRKAGAHCSHAHAPVRHAAVAALTMLDPKDARVVAASSSDDPFLVMASRYGDNDVELRLLNRVVLDRMTKGGSKGLKHAIHFAQQYAPHPAWHQIVDWKFAPELSRFAAWYRKLVSAGAFSSEVDALALNFGYSNDERPDFVISLSGHDLVEGEEVFSSDDFQRGFRSRLMVTFENHFAGLHDEAMVSAIRHVCLSHYLLSALNKAGPGNSELRLRVGYGSVSHMDIGIWAADGWLPYGA